MSDSGLSIFLCQVFRVLGCCLRNASICLLSKCPLTIPSLVLSQALGRGRELGRGPALPQAAGGAHAHSALFILEMRTARLAEGSPGPRARKERIWNLSPSLTSKFPFLLFLCALPRCLLFKVYKCT